MALELGAAVIVTASCQCQSPSFTTGSLRAGHWSALLNLKLCSLAESRHLGKGAYMLAILLTSSHKLINFVLLE